MRDQQQEDFRRNRIPASATDGTVSWTRLDNVPMMGRLVVVTHHGAEFEGFNKRGSGVAGGAPGSPGTANIVCQDCFCPCPASYDQLAMIGGCDLLPGASCQLNATGAYVDCNGNLTYYDDSGYADWESSNVSVATVGNGATGGLVTGVAPGTTDVSASFGDDAYTTYLPCNSFVRVFAPVTPYPVFPIVTISGPGAVPLGSDIRSIDLTASGIPSGGTYAWTTGSTKIGLENATSSTVKVDSVIQSDQPGDVAVTVSYTVNGKTKKASEALIVQKPTSLSLVKTAFQGPITCTLTDSAGNQFPGSGWERDVVWQVVDQWDEPILASAMSASDAISQGTPNSCNVKTSLTGTGYTDASGEFPDQYTLCSNACINGNCETDSTQTWTVNGIALSTGISKASQCSNITLNGQ